jgi:hypothetical protein
VQARAHARSRHDARSDTRAAGAAV